MSARRYFLAVITVLLTCSERGADGLQNVDYSNHGGGVLLNKIIKTPWNDENLSADDIRCYCDLPECITTGYMCRTARPSFIGGDEENFQFGAKSGGCFMEINESSSTMVTRRHGCVELLNDENKNILCDNVPRKHTDKNTNVETLLLCCQNDMCNHVDNPEHKKFPDSSTKRDETEIVLNINGTHPLANSQMSRMGVYPVAPPTYEDTNSELWFKIATIAVPILGAIILFLLVALAIRMLKTDNMDTSATKLHRTNSLSQGMSGAGGAGSSHFSSAIPGSTATKILMDQYSSPMMKENQLNYTKIVNNTSNNCDKKNEALAKRNQLINLEYSLLPQSCNDPNVKLTNTEEGVVNNMYSKNFKHKTTLPTLVGQNKSYYLNDSKCYEKEVLNPVAANWNN